MRVLITGSRDWTDYVAIRRALNALLQRHSALTIIHGDCPTGADRLAHIWATAAQTWFKDRRVTIEKYPADWERPCDHNCYHKPRTKNGKPYCPMAGHLRNQKWSTSAPTSA